MKIIDLTLDRRIGGFCATAVCTYDWYLKATAGAEDNLKIQRAIIKDSKAYRTLRADLLRGCVIPPIVLAISNIPLPPGLDATSVDDPAQTDGFIRDLQREFIVPRPTDSYIIDGLQRTNAIKQSYEELGTNVSEQQAYLKRPLRVEIWINIPFGAIAYRMLLLNAGQKPMSIKHQVEVLSRKLADDLGAIPGIGILLTVSEDRRTKPGQFSLSKLSQAFQAWLQGTPHIDVRNTMMEQLLAESAIDTLGTSLSGTAPSDDFKSLVAWFIEMDKSLWKDDSKFFGNDTVLLGIAGAVGSAQRNPQLKDRMRRCLDYLKDQAAQGKPEVLASNLFYELRQGEDVRKVNVGVYSRQLVYTTFQEFFINDGNKSMEECWQFGSAVNKSSSANG